LLEIVVWHPREVNSVDKYITYYMYDSYSMNHGSRLKHPTYIYFKSEFLTTTQFEEKNIVNW